MNKIGRKFPPDFFLHAETLPWMIYHELLKHFKFQKSRAVQVSVATNSPSHRSCREHLGARRHRPDNH
ncbi:MAG: hypothetical protein ABI621_08870, partial [Chloroflexota bacterium]